MDIGWRIAKEHWGKGLATEGAKRCLQYGLEELELDMIYSVAPVVNQRSIRVMEKIGMHKAGEFMHPYLENDQRLQRCVYYKLGRIGKN